jgi:hypothetical protein
LSTPVPQHPGSRRPDRSPCARRRVPKIRCELIVFTPSARALQPDLAEKGEEKRREGFMSGELRLACAGDGRRRRRPRASYCIVPTVAAAASASLYLLLCQATWPARAW